MNDKKAADPTEAGVNGAAAEADRDLQFRKLADSFIDVANRHCERNEPALISSSFLYGASRFCAFVVAGKTGEADAYREQKKAAIDYYTQEFRSMLEQNLDDYSRVFDEE